MVSVKKPHVAPFYQTFLNGINMTDKAVAAFQRHAPLPPTYKSLKTKGKQKYAQECKDLVVRNRVSALNAFMGFLRVEDEDVVGPEFDVDFDNKLLRFFDSMTLAGLASRTIQDRVEIVKKWRDLVIEMADTADLPDEFDIALTQAMYRRNVSQRWLSAKTGISTEALRGWMAGEQRPTRDVVAQLKKLEDALRLPAETLSKKLGFVIKRHQVSQAAKANQSVTTAYGRRLGGQYKREFRLNYHIAVPAQMQAQWHQLVAHKITLSRAHASSNDVWRVKPRHLVGSKPKWFSILSNGQVVPAADACWSYLSRYYSWLALEMQHGGAGYQLERINTLAWVLHDKMMTKFLAWMQVRSDNILHAGIPTILHYAAMLLRPKTGWLWLNPQLALTLDVKARVSCLEFDPEGMDIDDLTLAWQSRCAEVWEKYLVEGKFLSSHKSLRKSRDAKEPIADILGHERPISVVMNMLATLKKNPPWCLQTKRYAVWTRDVFLLSWMTANPLRINHFATATYLPDNSGHLYQAADSCWHYRCTRSEFKNSPEVFMNMPNETYDVELPKYVGDAAELYLREGRPMLAGAFEGNFLFLPEKFANQTSTDRTGTDVEMFTDRWTGQALSTRLMLVTRGLRVDKPGFGAHAFRHIVATDYLKRFPGAFKLVSELLCDRLETVMKEYGHTSPMDGLKMHYQAATAEFDISMAA